MDIPLAVMADLANIDAGGKLNILGVFSSFTPAKLPYTYPRLYLVVQLMAGPAEQSKERKLEAIFLDHDGGEVFKSNSIKFTLSGKDPGQEAIAPLIFEINNLTIKKPGTHHWSIQIDGDEKRRVAIAVRPKDKL